MLVKENIVCCPINKNAGKKGAKNSVFLRLLIFGHLSESAENRQNKEAAMILSGLEIEREIQSGNIHIDPFDRKRLNPNSYNLRLHPELLVYTTEILDVKKPNPFQIIPIPEDGLVLSPGTLYLGRTVEYTKTENFVPMLEGRSSMGRLGLYVHVTAGFGDVGFAGFWTLEIQCVMPIRVYPMIEVCQIYYHTVLGDVEPYRSGKYQNNTGIQPSFSYRDFR